MLTDPSVTLFLMVLASIFLINNGIMNIRDRWGNSGNTLDLLIFDVIGITAGVLVILIVSMFKIYLL